MDTATAKRATEQDALPLERPCWRVLPPEIVHIIMEMLGTDKETLSACTLASRQFTFAASCRLGRHISVNTVRRLQECASLLAAGGSAFQHVRSLDLGVTTRKPIHQNYWDDYLTILDVFARRRSLTRLWLTEVPFSSLMRGNRERARNAIISLTVTVNELGLYSCGFSSYPEMISLIRSFPLCTSLYVRDCFVRRTPGQNLFVDLPQHTLHVSDLELTSSPCHKPPVDVSTLPVDAAIDLSSLTGFSCHMNTAEQARHSIMTAAASPVERFQLMCEEPEGFHVLADPALISWRLESLIVGPIIKKSDVWLDRALDLDPSFPHLETVTILGHYPKLFRHPPTFLTRLDRMLSREHMFPRLKRLDIRIDEGKARVRWNRGILHFLPVLQATAKVYFWGVKY